MSIQTVDDGAGLRVLVAHGELDAVVGREMLGQVPELVRGAHHLVLDLTDVPFLDSGGLRLVDRLHRVAAASGATFAVLAPLGSAPRRLLQLVGMESLVLVED